jgi:hypothetical protein
MKGHRVSGLLALGILFFTFPVSMIAQQSLFESRDGDTSIFLENQGGVISANIGQSNLKLSYLHQNTAKNWGAGIDVFGELKGSTTDLFNATPPAKAAEVRAGWILQHLLTDHPRAAAIGPKSGETQECRLCDDWIAVQVGYQRSQIHLIDTSISPLAAPTGHGSTVIWRALLTIKSSSCLNMIFCSEPSSASPALTTQTTSTRSR